MTNEKCFTIFAIFFVFCRCNNICKGIVFEGGGTKGAYYAGVLKAFVEFAEPEAIMYNVSGGASVGTMAAGHIAAAEMGNEKFAAQRLEEVWSTIQRENLYIHWPFPWIFQGFYAKTGFLDIEPLEDYAKVVFEKMGGKFHRPFSYGYVEAKQGKYLHRDETMGEDMYPFYIRASASMPGIFQHCPEGNEILVDGGTIDNLNLRGVINKCLDLVEWDESAITLDFGLSVSVKISSVDLSSFTAYGAYRRAKELAKTVKTVYFLHDARRSFPRINWRYMVIPSETLPHDFLPLSFNREDLKKTMDLGYKDAKEVVQNGEPKKEKVESIFESECIKRRRIQ